MQMLLRHKLLIGGVTLAAAASAGGAYAATQTGTSRQAYLNDVAKRLHVTPGQLTSAMKAALIDRLNAEVAAGRLTQAQAARIKQRIENGRLPFFFGPGPRPPRGVFGRGAVSAVASYLGLSNAQLISDLRSGKSLAQIASARGKSVSGLEQAIESAAKARLDKAVAAGLISQGQEQKLLSRLSVRIGTLVNRKGLGHLRMMHAAPPNEPMPQGAPPPGGAFGPGGAPPPPAA